MKNERKTEELVRSALRKLGYMDDSLLVVEEQRSDNPRVQKLLKSASKTGLGGGAPEFIITSRTHADFVIVVECKADVLKHESLTHDRYADFAVDGALLYASYLSRHFDVLAIGVSGQSKEELEISHYLKLRGGSAAHSAYGHELLSHADYYKGYIEDPKKFNQDYARLLSYTKDLNELLHAKKVKESQRSLLISGVLIALKNAAFEASFMKYATAQQLANGLVATVVEELASADLPQSKLDALRQGFSFIKTHATLSTDKSFFQDLILSIDEHVNSFRRTHKYFDTLGQFYIEFLRYANNDKGLGIVLTPPHITQLFCDLANVNKSSVVFDNTCGTGGFLISAMQRMVKDAAGDSACIWNIQRSQIVGVEFQDDIYSLAVTNMVLHDDGKSNIYQGDCFALTPTVKQRFHPNIGFLNPPYKSKKSDREELEFVLDNLSALQVGGTCIALVPISCVLQPDGVGFLLKQRLLTSHTLEAVLSMPGELFHNSKAGVVTAAVVITAHIPHPADKKTWFGYCRDDGFTKRKHLGRVDVHAKWPNIRERWVAAYKNREIIPEFSLMQHVEAKDEWCAEAYMVTDYSTLTQEAFEKELKKYVVFQILDDVAEEDHEEADRSI